MRQVLKLMLVAGGAAVAALPAWAQSPAMSYSFGPTAGSPFAAELPPPRLHAPGADAIRWLGGLGSTGAEPGPAPISTEAIDRNRRK